jgi:hypothetical protein
MKKATGGRISNLTEKIKIRRFGIIAFLFFGSLFLLGLWARKPVPVFLFGFLSLLGLSFICVPGPMGPIYNAWLKVAHFIGRIITALFLTLAYYLVITPSAFLKRLFGGPPIPLKPDRNASTYWVTRDEPAQPRDRFVKRY